MFKKAITLFQVLLILWMTGCHETDEDENTSRQPVVETETPPFDPMTLKLGTQDLIQGRSFWMETCAVCHLEGLGGAPVIANKNDWEPRIQKGMATLYTHALEGYYGNVGEMPARGGNEDLTDDQVKLAVDFVIHASK